MSMLRKERVFSAMYNWSQKVMMKLFVLWRVTILRTKISREKLLKKLIDRPFAIICLRTLLEKSHLRPRLSLISSGLS